MFLNVYTKMKRSRYSDESSNSSSPKSVADDSSSDSERGSLSSSGNIPFYGNSERKFAQNLLNRIRMSEGPAGDELLANMCVHVLDELDIFGNDRKITEFLSELGFCSPHLLAALCCDYGVEISTWECLKLTFSYVRDEPLSGEYKTSRFSDSDQIIWRNFATCVGKLCEYHVIDANKIADVEDVYKFASLQMSTPTLMYLCQEVCQHCKRKANAFAVVNTFTESMMDHVACSMIVELISKTAFQELSGKLSRAWPYLSDHLRDNVRKDYLEQQRVNSETDQIVASDEDSDGNLQGFIDKSESEELNESDSDEHPTYKRRRFESDSDFLGENSVDEEGHSYDEDGGGGDSFNGDGDFLGENSVDEEGLSYDEDGGGGDY